MSDSTSNRRDFLTGRSALTQVEAAGNRLAEELVQRPVPSRGPTMMLRTTAMACDFDVIVNPDGPGSQLEAASDALDLVHVLEQQLSIYREDSELSCLNRNAFPNPTTVEPELFDLLERARLLSAQTGGAFDPAAGALVKLWSNCRKKDRIPLQSEIDEVLAAGGVARVAFDYSKRQIAFERAGIEFNLGAIGKGYAVDKAGEYLLNKGVSNWLIHGGRSSILAHGVHSRCEGWPVGLRNPLLPDKPFATLMLCDEALATSGTAVQWFRHGGRRYGHILDPRTGWPVESLLSVSVIARDSATADALSTAFFVLGVEKSLAYCDNLSDSVGAIFFPIPKQGQMLQPVLHNVAAEKWFPA
ncbi:FAD:protein FMN transferase [Schlesneria sp. DSM 10557]|uniref:FAD:protein FMN transferase n=1 Tax=Schlesneria sp. DSM 10557 TaxID=3044399 RepID=UPI0035A099BD